MLFRNFFHRYAELCQDISFLPWLSCRLSVQVSATFDSNDLLVTRFVDKEYKVSEFFLEVRGER